jgi:hypothetical protein
MTTQHPWEAGTIFIISPHFTEEETENICLGPTAYNGIADVAASEWLVLESILV